jgi:hypothetical protein
MAGQEAIWHVMVGGKEQGPLTKAQVLEYLTHGIAGSGDFGRDELGYVVHSGTYQFLGKHCESLPAEV